MGDIGIEDLSNNLQGATRAVEFESTGGGSKLVRKTNEHLEAEKNLQGKSGDELNMAKRELTKQRSTEPEESCKRCRKSKTNKLSVNRAFVLITFPKYFCTLVCEVECSSSSPSCLLRI